MDNIPLSSICNTAIHFRNISEFNSLSDRILCYREPLRYICTDIGRKSFKYRSKRNTNRNISKKNTNRNLECYIDTH
jgi:hypothetical protein